MIQNEIIIKKAKTHNLKSLSLSIPKHKLVMFTGVSGSGKSSLVFDTIYTEAQRQLIETFSTFARERLPKLSRPAVEEIKNLSTAIVIDQKRMGNNLRSTVGTATEINTYLRLLFSRFGSPFIGPSFYFSFNHPEGMCSHCHGLGKRAQVDLNLFLDKNKSLREGAITHPEFKKGGWFWREVITLDLFDPDKKLKDYSKDELNLLLYTPPIPIKKFHGAGIYSKNFEGIAARLERKITQKAEDEVPTDQKDVYKKYIIYEDCNICSGFRLNDRAKSVTLKGNTINDLCNMELLDLLRCLKGINKKEASSIINKATFLLQHLIEIGVGYLTLNRTVSTLSGGESQRVKMARQLDCDLTDLLYILDEPSIGLHPKDTEKLLSILFKLREKGNSVFVVEHDPQIIKSAEWIVDIGPKAGSGGGRLEYSGPIEGLKDTQTITAKALFSPPNFTFKPKEPKEFISLKKASIHNLKNVSVDIPKGLLTCITGVAGSGKSSLINHCFVKQYPSSVVIDQSPIGKSSRANAATYTGAFDLIRKEFSTHTKKEASLFSFNSKGACQKCSGRGFLILDLHFLDTVTSPCQECLGTRYHPEVLKLTYQNHSIAQVLDKTASEVIGFFKNPQINKRLSLLDQVGLGYIKIGQSLSTLSGGESQRLKIASQLHKEGNIYIMDEPTTGLHLWDIERLYGIMRSLTDKNNTMIVIEHNLDIIKRADWIIDMGPAGGKNGGQILFSGPPQDLIKSPKSITGKYLKAVLGTEGKFMHSSD